MKRLFCLSIATVFLHQVNAQDAQMISPQSALLLVNPSYAGSNGGFRLQTAYQQSAPGDANYALSADQYLQGLQGGISVMVTAEDYMWGSLVNSGISIAYAHYLQAMEGKLKIVPSVQYGNIRKRLDVNSLMFGNQFSGTNAFYFSNQIPKTSVQSQDWSSGLLVQYREVLSGGFSLYHLNRPDLGVLGTYHLPPRLMVHGAYNMTLTDRRLLNFFMLYTNHAALKELRLNCTMVLNHLVVAAGAATNPSVFASAGYRGKYGSLLVSYERTYSRLADMVLTPLQVHASLNFRNQENRDKVLAPENW